MNDYRITSEEALEWCNQYPYLNSGIHVKLFPKPTTHPTYGLEGIYFPSEVHSPLEAPVNHVPPHILGSGYPGDALIAFTGIWENTVSFLYQWRVDEISIPGAIEGTYTPTNYDIGHTISLVVTAFNITGTLTVIGDNTIQIIGTLVTGPPNNITPPSISGSPVAGQTLVATSGTWDTIGVLTGLWYSNGILIVREIMSYTFELTAVEEGTVITFVETNTTGGGSTSASSTATAVVTSPAEVMVTFDGTNDWLTRDANLTSVVDGRRGIASFWISMNGGDDANQTIIRNASGDFEFRRLTTNVIRFIIKASGGSPSFQAETINTFEAGVGVYHVLVAWDWDQPHSANKMQCIINGADTGVVIVDTDDTSHDIGYSSTDWSVGATAAGATRLNADLGPFYLNLTETMDITLSANIHKFFDSVGKAAYLGTDGSGPTGSIPTLFIHGNKDVYATNHGTGGGMTLHGALTNSIVVPQIILAPLLMDVYVDSVAGDNTTGDGSAMAPWASVGKAALYADEGATIHLVDGSEFREGIRLKRSATIKSEPGTVPAIMRGDMEIKTQSWTDESAIGSNIWSTLITRDSQTTASQTGMLYRNDVKGHVGKTAAVGCTTNGDWFHTAGNGPQKLYIYNSGGNPASDGTLTSVSYQIITNGIVAANLATVAINNLTVKRFRTNITVSGTDVSTGDDLILKESTYNSIHLLGPATSSTWTNCTHTANGTHQPGGSTEGAGMCWFTGAASGATNVSPTDIVIDSCTVVSHDGEDVIGQGYYGGGAIEVIGGTMECTNGENVVDIKSGTFHAHSGFTFICSSTAGGGNEAMVIHNLVTTVLLEDGTLKTTNGVAQFSFGDGTVATFKNLTFWHEGTSVAAQQTCIKTNFQAGDGIVIDGCKFIGPKTGTGTAANNATSCVRFDKGSHHTVTNSTFVMRNATSMGLHIRAVPPGAPHEITNNIFVTVGTTSTNGYPIFTSAQSPSQLSVNLGYNHYYRSDNATRPLVYDHTNLVAYDSVTVLTKDANASTGDPKLNSPASPTFDYTLQVGSPALNTGDPAQDGKVYRDSMVTRGDGTRNKGSEVAA